MASETVTKMKYSISQLNTDEVEQKEQALVELKQLFELATQQDLKFLSENSDLSPVISLLASEEASIAQEINKALLSISRSDPDVVNRFKGSFDAVIRKGSVKMCRVFDLMVQIANLSEEHLEKVVTYLEQLLNAVRDTTDVLNAISCAEILCSLNETEHGRRYLDSGSLSVLEAKLKEQNLNPDSQFNFWAPEYLKVFGVFSRYQPKIVIEKYNAVIQTILSILLFKKEDLLNIAIETIGIFGSTVEGKKLLDSRVTEFCMVLRTLGYVIKTSTPMTVRALDTIELLMFVPRPDPDGEMETLTETWFNSIMPDAEKRILELARQPFKETRLKTYQLIKVIASHMWGQKKLAGVAEFVDRLLDRTWETDKECKEAKYDIVALIVESPFASFAFNREVMNRMKKYQSQGPFYVEPESAVETSGAR